MKLRLRLISCQQFGRLRKASSQTMCWGDLVFMHLWWDFMYQYSAICTAISCALGFQRNFLEWNVKNDTVIKGVQSWLHNVMGCMFFSSVPVCLAESMPFSVGLWRCWSSSSTKAWSPNSTGCSLWRAGEKKESGRIFWCFDSDRKCRKFRNTPEYWVCQSCQVNGATFVLGQNLSSKHLSGDGASHDVGGVSRGDEFVLNKFITESTVLSPADIFTSKAGLIWDKKIRGIMESKNEQNRFFLSSASMEGKASSYRLIRVDFAKERGSSAWWQRIKRLVERFSKVVDVGGGVV